MVYGLFGAATWADPTKGLDMTELAPLHDPSEVGRLSWPVLLVTAVVVVGVTILARRQTRRGRRWSGWRTGTLVAGIALASSVVALPSVFGGSLARHMGGHILLMMLAPPLIVLGGPLRLLRRSLSPGGRRIWDEIATDPAVRRVLRGRRTALWLTVDYYGSMFVFVVTPLSDLAERHASVHALAHAYFLGCGLLFWAWAVGEDAGLPISSRQIRTLAVAAGVAVMPLLAVITSLTAHGGHSDRESWWIIGIGGVLSTLAGLAVISLRSRGHAAAAGVRRLARDVSH